MESKEKIIERIKFSQDEQQVRMITEIYSNADRASVDVNLELSEEEKLEIYKVGIVRWGELTGNEGVVIGFEVRKNYAIDALVKEYSFASVDGVPEAREVMTEYPHPDNRKVKGIKYGLMRAFKVVYEAGRELYESRFTPEIAEAAFLTACPYAANQMHGEELLSEAVDEWFRKLDGANQK